MATQSIHTTNTAACGRISMQASVRRSRTSLKQLREEVRLEIRKDDGKLYVMNDKVHFEEKVWVCRRKHESGEGNAPGKGYRFWKEDG